MTIWQELGIDATEDAGAIKSAYAARLKVTRPDDDPEGFQRLRAAYATALQLAGGHAVAVLPQPSEAETVVLDRPADTSPEFRTSEMLAERDEVIKSLRQVFAGGDGEEAVAAIEAAMARQLLPIDVETQLVNALAGLLYEDRAIPARRLLEIAKRFGWYGVPDELRGPNGQAERLLCLRIDAELWLMSTKWLARSWGYWIGQREPAAARIVLGKAPIWLNWIAPPEPLLSRKLAEALLYAPFIGDALDLDRVAGIQNILKTRRKQPFGTIGAIVRMAIMFVLVMIGLYFNSQAAMGVIIASFVWFRFAGAISRTYRTELLFPLIAVAWVVLSVLVALVSPPPQPRYEN